MKEQLNKVLTRTLAVMEAPETTPKERAAYGRILDGIIKTLKMAQDPKATPQERATYRNIGDNLAEAVERIPELPPEERVPCMVSVEATATVAEKLQEPNYRPKDPEDRFKIQKRVEETSDALAKARDPRATPKERSEAQRKLDRRAGSLQHPQYLEFIEEVKRHKAPVACVVMIRNRTREVGWHDGSLWGLSDSACAATVAEAAKSSSRWSSLFACVQRTPFSKCGTHIPKS
ncbi:hypothetical protein AB0K02_28295 [Streptomyces sp. NPDC049597]|uniref:hypothetical protein n=1 Tax=Streptomyces sp. NPDC049597 TaxID=3155276 RepID=UPI00344A2E31